MPLSSASVGACTECFVHDVDARWLMAYAAGLGDLNPCYMDTAASQIVTQYAGAQAQRVRRVGGRFVGMVLMPSTLTLNVQRTVGNMVFFEVCNEQAEPILSQGFVVLDA